MTFNEIQFVVVSELTFSTEFESNILFQFIRSLLYITRYASVQASPVLPDEEIPLVTIPVTTLGSVKSTYTLFIIK